MLEQDEETCKYSNRDYTDFFAEAMRVAQARFTSLGSTSAEITDPTLVLLRELEEKKGEVAEFGTSLTILPLRKSQLPKGEVPSEIEELMRHNHFYLVRIPVTLMPRPGVAFTRLQCILEFSPGVDVALRPIAHKIFPSDQWQTVLRANMGLKVGLDAGLSFRAAVENFSLQQGVIEGELSGLVSPDLQATASMTVGEFDYNIRRPQIKTTGEGSAKIRWFLDSREFLEQESLWLGVVIRVPRQIESIDVAGALLAHRNPQWLAAKLGDLLKLMSKRAGDFFLNGAPIEDTRMWSNILLK